MKVVQFMIGSHGGAERFYVKLMRALRDHGLDQHAIHNDHCRLVEDVKAAGVPATVIPFAKGVDREGRRLYREALAVIKPDIVMHWMNRAARRAEMGPHINVGRLGGFYPVRYYWRCNHLIANTPGIHTDIIRQGWPGSAAHMISNFGELTPEPPVSRASLGVPDDAFLLLGMGRFDPWKGFDVLIAAMKYLPQNTVLCLAGDGTPMPEFRALADREGVAGRVRFLGWRDDQAALLGACDLCVVPSSHEPLGNVILEAWSLGVPVVAAASEGPGWLITHGVTGLLCKKRDAADLAAKIAQARENPALLRGMAERGHAKWEANFSRQGICRQYLDFFNAILSGDRSLSMPARMTRMLKGLALQYRSQQEHKEFRPASG
jgi:glycosyltransferase involved in cell wall biosynthesis